MAVVVVAAVIVALVVLLRQPPRPTHPTLMAPSPAQRVERVERVTRAQRDELAAKIHASLSARASTSGSATSAGATSSRPVPRLPAPEEPTLTLEQVGKAAQQALTASIPILAACYPQGGGTAVARMVMFSDPDLGTVIDTERVTGDDGQPLDRAIEDCMRDAIETLALPPLGAPGKLPLEYSFRFE